MRGRISATSGHRGQRAPARPAGPSSARSRNRPCGTGRSSSRLASLRFRYDEASVTQTGHAHGDDAGHGQQHARDGREARAAVCGSSTLTRRSPRAAAAAGLAWTSTICPLRSRTTRSATWAMAALCVISTTVLPNCCFRSTSSPQHPLAGGEVERPGRLVAQQQRGVLGQRPGDGHPLLLAAGKLRGEMVDAGLPGRPAAGPRPRPSDRGSSRSRPSRFRGRSGSARGCRTGRRSRPCRGGSGSARPGVKAVISRSPNQTRPLVTVSSPPTRFRMVVLPDPLGPTITSNSPAQISSETSRRASTATSPIWNVLLTFSRRSSVRFGLSTDAGDIREIRGPGPFSYPTPT